MSLRKDESGRGVSGPGVMRAAGPMLLDRLRPLGTTIEVHSGQDLFGQGDMADALYVVLDGLAEIATLSDDGRRVAHLMLPPGTVFGEMALVDGGRRSAGVSARSQSRFLRVSRDKLLEAVHHDNELAVGLLHLAIARLDWMSTQLEGYTLQPLSVRLARCLLSLDHSIGQSGELKISQADLADHVAATREAISKILSVWRADSLVDIGRSRIVILNRGRLQNIADFGPV